MGIEFARSRRSTIGVEWELGLVDRETGDLRPVAAEALDSLAARRGEEPGEHPRIKHEFMTHMVELVTGVCDGAEDARGDLARSLDELRGAAEPIGVEPMCAGTHPFARWGEQGVTEDPRYAELVNRTQWWGRHLTIFGVHVHVGVDDVEKVMPIAASLLRFVPHLQALSASSPFWDGVDTGYASNRAMLFQQLPTAGLPYQFRDWAEFERCAAGLTRTGVIDEVNDIHWDIRPAPKFGTIELRICDGMPTLEETIAIAALAQCLVDDLAERLDRGERLPTMPDWFVRENKWRAARYGLDAIIITDAEGEERLVTDHLADELDRLAPVAERLGCEHELEAVRRIVAVGASYQRQREVAERTGGDLRAVAFALVAAVRAGRPIATP